MISKKARLIGGYGRYRSGILKLSQFLISHCLVRIRPKGAVLEARELADFMPVLKFAEISLQVREGKTSFAGLMEP
jgi:hypothetical protein